MDKIHLVTLGSDPKPVRKDTGFALEEMSGHLDVMAYCIYPAPSYGNELELISYGAFQTRFFATGGQPAFLHEGPGVSSSAAGEEVVADRFRVWMYSSLANGNIGVLPWCYTDYEEAQHFIWPRTTNRRSRTSESSPRYFFGCCAEPQVCLSRATSRCRLVQTCTGKCKSP